MLFSYKELSRLANLPTDIDCNKVVNAINSIGFEVEEVKEMTNIQGIKFGKILNVTKNPNADKLNVCEIEFEDKNRIIQTNADNVHKDMYVIAFVPGSKAGEITFDSKELMGVTSEGMLTSLNELGFDSEFLRDGATDGIQGYDEINLSIDPIEHLGLNDSIIDVDILSNRSDAQSYIIMARELAAYFQTKPLEIVPKSSNFSSSISVSKGNHNKLSFIEAKPDFKISIQDKLLLVKTGIKSINDIVDLTNLTLINTGQPSHVYDKNKVGDKFSSSLSSDKVNILGNKEVELNNDLVITSNNVPVSIAGVMGLEETSVSNETNDLIFEFGIFNIKEVRKSIKSIKISSQSGIQSSKIISDGTFDLGIKYLTSKLNNFSNTIEHTPSLNKEISFSTNKLSKVAGFNIVDEEGYTKAISSLETLGFKFKDKIVSVPSYRHDVETQQDLNEEIFRYYGYNNFPLIAPKIYPSKVEIINDKKIEISSMGYDEVVLYTLTSLERNIFNPFDLEQVKLETFVSKEREVIRTSQLPPMLEVIEYNSKRNISNINLFAIGSIGENNKSIIISSNTKSFKEIKQDVVNILPSGISFSPTKDENLHPGVSADIFLNDKKIGYIGKVNPKISNIDSFIAEFIYIQNNNNIKVKDYDKNALKTRDVTYELNEKENIDKHIITSNVLEADVIDVYKKDDIRKVTVRYKLEDSQLKEFDKK